MSTKGIYEPYGQFIDGAWAAAGGGTSPVVSPTTGESLGEAPRADAADSQAAISAAAAGLASWRATPAWDRADTLHRVADAMAGKADTAARMITLETGKPLAQSGREWALSLDQFRWFAEEARRIYGRIVESRAPGGRLEVHHEPIGVVAAFTAWNFPAALPARKVAPALAAGCSVIVRPSSQTPGSAMVLFECLREAELPAGVANLLVGPTTTTYDLLMASPIVRKVSLTGSTSVGQQMVRDAAATLKRTTMELGGNAPMVVFEDADLEAVLNLAVPTKYANAGQVCVTPDRFFIHESLHDDFVEGFAARASALVLGDGLDASVQMGPLINQRRLEATEAVIADAVQRGGRIVTGGQRPADQNRGFFFAPTVITDLPDDAMAMREENFAPIAAITRFTDPDELYARANVDDFGLSAYVFTANAARARDAVATLEYGMVGVNSFALAAAEAPFGGIKSSGMGREGGTEAIHDYLNVKLAQMTV
jgi:succinate-semialdehyde dehydrogenase/glutarate-semialdehyde dehydrogenase